MEKRMTIKEIADMAAGILTEKFKGKRVSHAEIAEAAEELNNVINIQGIEFEERSFIINNSYDSTCRIVVKYNLPDNNDNHGLNTDNMVLYSLVVRGETDNRFKDSIMYKKVEKVNFEFNEMNALLFETMTDEEALSHYTNYVILIKLGNVKKDIEWIEDKAKKKHERRENLLSLLDKNDKNWERFFAKKK